MRVNLLGGTYLARSIIADAQACVNLYPEKNPQDASAPYTHQLTPGLALKKLALTPGVSRGMYTATNGFLYYVVGTQGAVYYIDSNFNITQLGSLADGLSTLCSFQDNGNVLVITNGVANAGWAVNLQEGLESQPVTFSVQAGGSGTAISALTSSSLTATATVASTANLETGDEVFIAGANFAPYNGLFTITVISSTQFTYSLGTATTSPDTGMPSYTVPGTYSDIPLTGGSGTGASILSADVSSTNQQVLDITLAQAGTGYVVGDVLTAAPFGALSGLELKVTAVGAQVNAFAAISDPNFLGAVGIGYLDTFLVFSQPNTRNWYSSLSNITFASLTASPGEIVVGTIQSGGSGGTNGTYANVALTGGNGEGAVATFTVSGNKVTAVSFSGAGNSPGLGYQSGDTLSAASASIGDVVNFTYEVMTANPVAFDPTYVAAKTGYPDLLATLIVVHREIWLLGAFESAEVWYDAGGASFPFQILPGVFLQHGAIAPYSVATHDLSVFWLSIDAAGQGTVFQGEGYQARRISTWAIANAIQQALESGASIADAQGMVYKQQDHVFYVLTFPSADFTYVYDVTEELWHQRTWTDPASGEAHRVRFNCCALAYNVNVCADWENGNIYTLDLATYTDNGAPIVRTRAFPHLVNDGKRVSYDALRLDIECGDGYANAPTQQPLISLAVSDDRGRTFWNAPTQSLGQVGNYLAQPQWRQLGLARDRVFKVSWSEGVFTALQGAWLDVTPSET